MNIKTTIGALCLGAVLFGCGGGGGGSASVTPAPVVPAPAPINVVLTGKALQDELESVRVTHGYPGLSVVLVADGKTEAYSTGYRTAGGSVAITSTDKFQLGSLSKAASAMLIARLVEQKKLRWDSTLAELFPAWSAQMQASLRGVTVEQLLRHRAGLKRDLDLADRDNLRQHLTGDLTADRKTVVQYVLQQTPALTPNSKYAYSNVGYLLAGLIAELAGGDAYTTLMEQQVFAPLNINASFGLPEDAGLNALSGHSLQGSSWKPAVYGADQRMVLAVMQPAGGMMASMTDYGKYMQEHLQGLRGNSAFLSQDTFRLIHTPVEGYAFGWGVGDDAVVGRYSSHNGTIGTYYSITIMLPASNRAVAVSCNCHSAAAMEKLDQFARKVVAPPG